MATARIVLQDGTTILSESPTGTAILSAKRTECVQPDGDDLAPGAACSTELEIKLQAAEGATIPITAGSAFAYYETNGGAEELIGQFIAEQPTKSGYYQYSVIAYDRMTLADKDLSGWLREQQEAFPMMLWALAQAVAAQCGLTIASTGLPINGSYQVQAFYADGVTGRQILAWIAQASGTFCRVNPAGALVFEWYTDAELTYGITAGGQQGSVRAIVRLDGDMLRTQQAQVYRIGLDAPFYFQGSLSYEQYSCKKIDKVQIKLTDDDVGAIYPPDEEAPNALALEGNLLLTTASADNLQPVAQALYERFKDITYVPCSLKVQTAVGIRPGQIVQVTDAVGNSFKTYIMQAEYSGGVATLSSTGNPSRTSTAAVNYKSYTNLTGKVLEISASVDGLKIANRDLQGNLASLELTVEGIETNVQKKLDDMTDYIDQETGEIKDQAVSEAVNQAMQQVDESLTFYPTKVEMNSAIEQSASEINLTVSQKLTGYSTTSQMQQYVNGQTGGILDDAKDYTDGQLKLYPTTIEMDSAIEQSASSIRLSVNETLTMYPSNSQMQSYVNGQVSGAVSDANDYTDGQLQNYVTQVQMESAIEQSADNINLSVTQRLTSYSTTSQMQSYVQGQTSDAVDEANGYTDDQVANRPTTTTVQNMIDIGIEGITLSASTNGTTSTITLKSGSATISSAQINFTGVVTFSDLYTSGRTQINADNITTGTVRAKILSASQGASVNDICATEIDAGVIYIKVGSLAGAERTIFSLGPLYDSSNGNYYAQMQLKGDLSTWQEMNLYMGEGNFNIVSPPNGPSGTRVGLVITVDNLTMWNDMILHGDLNVASILGRAPEWRYSNELGTYVFCGPRTA